MHIAIVEDEMQVQELLISYIHRYFRHDTKKFDIAVFSDGDEILETYSADFDLILLDIQMKRVEGIKTAEHIRKLDECVHLVFVTNQAHCAIQGYAVNALDFILKPVNYYTLEHLLNKVETLVKKRDKHYIALQTDIGLIRMDISEIQFIETVGRKLKIHTESGDYQLNKTLKSLETMLSPYGFCRCNNCFLVNLDYVEQVNHHEIVLAGYTLSISRPRYVKFMEVFTKHIGGVET